MSLVLVTGAAGQVGSRLIRQLLERNYEVRGLILPDDPSRSRLDGLEIEIVESNLLDMAVCEKVIEGADAVIHTANLVGPLPGMSETEFFDNNVRNTFNIVYAASKCIGQQHVKVKKGYFARFWSSGPAKRTAV